MRLSTSNTRLPIYQLHASNCFAKWKRCDWFPESDYLSLLFKRAFVFCCVNCQTPCTWVDTEAQLIELADKLLEVTEFAVDLEHHNLRSYAGFTCLMQVCLLLVWDKFRYFAYLHALTIRFPPVVRIFLWIRLNYATLCGD